MRYAGDRNTALSTSLSELSSPGGNKGMLAHRRLTRLRLQRWPAPAVRASLALLVVLLCLLPIPPAAPRSSNTFNVTDVEGGSANVAVTLSGPALSGGMAFTSIAYATAGTDKAAETDAQSAQSALTIAQNGTSGNQQVRANKDIDNSWPTRTHTLTLYRPAENPTQQGGV